MKKAFSTEDWNIYNCHIHTFTRKHTPNYFFKFVLSDARLGRINWFMIPVYLLGVIIYLSFLYILAGYIGLLATNLSGLTLPIYAFLLLMEAILTVPVVLVVLMILVLIVIFILQALIDWWMPNPKEQTSSWLMPIKKAVNRGQRTVLHPNLLIDLLTWLNPASSYDIFERTARFLRIAAQPSQEAVFEEIVGQYPEDTVFVVLPMDMAFMKLGEVKESIDRQHTQLLSLAKKSNGQIIPFYAADPRRENLVEQVRKNLKEGQFRGIKIYPNLGYPPNCNKLMEVYEICVEYDLPVMTHCSPGGIWQYGLSRKFRRLYTMPSSYLPVLKEFPTLKLCLAHFGGAEEWARQLDPKRAEKENFPEGPWVKTIYEMIASGDYPNLYTDVAYTVFTPRVKRLYIDLIDYLKVMLAHPLVRSRVLFGSDYYMVEQERISEKEASILLRSRLGEDLYKQIAYINPREYLGIETHEPITTAQKSLARR